MPLKFNPKYKISAKIIGALIKLEGIKERIKGLPITPGVLKTLRETARLFSTHYSTQIEGNRLSAREVEDVLDRRRHFPGRERDEKEVRGYYRALEYAEELANKKRDITEKQIQTMYSFVMGKKSPTSYRKGQNIIKDSLTGRIVYMPPEAKDVPRLMAEMANWLNETEQEVPCPIRAAIVHYQFATIHPYYDGNGRMARLLASLVLHLGGYDLKGIYCLEEYYSRDLKGYYNAISIGPSHNYYEGRAVANITKWIEYFIFGMLDAFNKVEAQAKNAAMKKQEDKSEFLRKLDARQRKALILFEDSDYITANDLGKLFGFASRTARQVAAKWVKQGFLKVVDPSKKARKYELGNIS